MEMAGNPGNQSGGGETAKIDKYIDDFCVSDLSEHQHFQGKDIFQRLRISFSGKEILK
ncbi:MAG: hypothetical protein HFH21_15450 [Ruminococcus sp.]|nr:hypothetical protein [uncultured Schaedlerella sp.]MCI8769128.1 hypothetical protein [Ruminococcus sp.]